MESSCPQCDAPMSCDPTGNCWCFTLPPVLPTPTDNAQRCLCPACLARKVESAPATPLREVD